MYEGNTVIVSRWGVAMLSSEIVSVQDSNNSDEVDTTDNFSNKHPIVLTYDTLIIDVQSLIILTRLIPPINFPTSIPLS